MTNKVASMSNGELQGRLELAVDASNSAFEGEDWEMAQYWHLRAVELTAELEVRGVKERQREPVVQH